MSANLRKELADALHAAGDSELEVVDPSRNRTYVIVDSEIHSRAMEALRRQQDHDAIAEGIAQMEAGQSKPLDEAFAARIYEHAMTFRVIVLPRSEADIEANARWRAEHHSAVFASDYWTIVVCSELDIRPVPFITACRLLPSNGHVGKELNSCNMQNDKEAKNASARGFEDFLRLCFRYFSFVKGHGLTSRKCVQAGHEIAVIYESAIQQVTIHFESFCGPWVVIGK